jgi:UDP-glucuronate 4-epimerase
MKIIVTGAAGFIGFHVCKALLGRGDYVVGADNLNDYYDPALKRARIAEISDQADFSFHELDVSDPQAQDSTHVLHLAAQAGVRYSLVDPYAYVQANVTGQLAVLEASRRLSELEHFVYASSSSVYGCNKKLPFAIDDRVDQPASLYAATKRAAELIADCQSRLYELPTTGLRFFTVYGPWGRPDMAYYLFTKAIFEGNPIRVFNKGRMKRDFTYIDDVVQGVLAALDRPPAAGDGQHRLYNLGNHKPEDLLYFIEVLERACGREAIKQLAEMQPGDVEATFADITESQRDLGFEPRTAIEEGLPRFVEWYRSYHKL